MIKSVTGVTGCVTGYVTGKSPVFTGLFRVLRALCARVRVMRNAVVHKRVCTLHVQARNPVTPVTPVTHAYFMRVSGVLGSRAPRNTPITS